MNIKNGAMVTFSVDILCAVNSEMLHASMRFCLQNLCISIGECSRVLWKVPVQWRKWVTFF
jgi:hypothetical protein